MSCRTELKKLQEDAAKPPVLREREELEPGFRHGYAYGWHAGIEDALEIVEDHVEEEE